MGIETAILIGSVALGTASAVGNYNQSKSAARQTAKEGEIVAANRAEEIKKLAAKQRVSYLKAGLELEGTPQIMMNDTYDKGIADINAIRGSYNQKVKNILTAGRSKLLGDLASTALGAVGTMAMSGLGSVSSGSATSGAMASGGEFIGTTTSGLNSFDLTGTAASGGNINISNLKFPG